MAENECAWVEVQRFATIGRVPEGKQPTFALLREWVPATKPLDREEALARLATRYFSSHGPATAQDLMRWAGVTAAETKLALGGAGKQLSSVQSDGVTYWLQADHPQPSAAASGIFLLPGFDEYLLGYRDRTMIVDSAHAPKIVPGNNGVFRPTIVHDGQVIGTWSASATKKSVRVAASPFDRLTKLQQRLFLRAAERYALFLGKSLAAS